MFPIMNFRRLRIYFFILVMLFVASCTIKYTIELNPDIRNPPIFDKLPLTIGIYYPAEFKNYEFRRKVQSKLWVIPAGKVSVALFDKVLPIMFGKVEQLNTWPISRQVNPELSGVLIPSIQTFDFYGVEGFLRAEIVYQFTLYSLNGQSIASWEVKGIGLRKLGFEFTSPETRIGQATDFAMQDAVAKFIIKFREIPEVQKWLQGVAK
jgi:hypothetical protein